MNNSKYYARHTQGDLSTLSGGRPSVPASRHPETKNGRVLLSYAIAGLVISVMLYAFLLSLSWFRTDDQNKRMDLRPGLMRTATSAGASAWDSSGIASDKCTFRIGILCAAHRRAAT